MHTMNGSQGDNPPSNNFGSSGIAEMDHSHNRNSRDHSGARLRHPPMTLLKRKLDQSDEDSCKLLEENIKKCRISFTPGELRLRKDLGDLQNHGDFICEPSVDPASITIIFNRSSSPDSCTYVPNKFTVRVPRYYPHSCPSVKCVDAGFADRMIAADGTVLHPALGEEWNAINSLQTVVDILSAVRKSYAANYKPTTGFIRSSPLFSPTAAQKILQNSIAQSDSCGNFAMLQADRMSEDTCEESVANSVDTLQWRDHQLAIDEQLLPSPVGMNINAIATGACHMNECS